MLNINNAFLTVFEVEDKGKYFKGRVSSSRKDQDGNYVNSYWNAVFLGKAKDAATSINGRTRIHVTNAGISNEPYTDPDGEKKYYVTLKIFDFESSDDTDKPKTSDDKKTKTKTTKTKKSTKKPVTDEDEDDDVPF